MGLVAEALLELVAEALLGLVAEALLALGGARAALVECGSRLGEATGLVTQKLNPE